MIQFLPMIFSALMEAPKLFSAGKEVYEAVTGSQSTAATPADLARAVEALPPDQQRAWADAMKAKVEAYKAETDRLRIEEGELSPELLRAIPPAARAKVALMRMTTRPLVVRRLLHVMLLPVYVMAYDAAMMAINNAVTLFGGKVTIGLLGEKLFGANSIYASIYAEAQWPCVMVVVTYMTLRQFEKPGAGSPVGAIADGLKNIAGMFKGRK